MIHSDPGANPIETRTLADDRRPPIKSRSISGANSRVSVNKWPPALKHVCTVAVALLMGSACVQRPREPTLAEIYTTLAGKRFVDLTHPFGPGSPHWKGFEPMRVRTLYTIDKAGFQVEEFCHVGQWGTHVDPPAHFHRGLRTVDQVDPKEMLLPLVVLDVHDKVAREPDYVVSLEDVKGWEARYGRIPERSFVAMRTDWSKRWPSGAAMQNLDAKGVAHYPGWSREVLRLLYEDRKISASGHETTDTDPGFATTKGDYSLESYVLGTNHYQIELLANLDQVPEHGALVMVSFPSRRGEQDFRHVLWQLCHDGRGAAASASSSRRSPTHAGSMPCSA